MPDSYISSFKGYNVPGTIVLKDQDFGTIMYDVLTAALLKGNLPGKACHYVLEVVTTPGPMPNFVKVDMARSGASLRDYMVDGVINFRMESGPPGALALPR